jgi:hypothetical protein
LRHFVVLACEALARSVYASAATTPHTVSVRLFRQGLHDTPDRLRDTLQAEIDAIQPGECDAVLLAYGLCGRSTAGLVTRHTPLVIARAHDCITLYLGSQGRYQEEFGKHPGTYWYSVDYMERNKDGSVELGAASLGLRDDLYEEYVQKYGKDNADYLMEVMGEWAKHYTRAVFIDTGLGDSGRFEGMARRRAEEHGWAFERRQGDRRLIEMLVGGEWPEDEFLVVPPGHRIVESYADGVVRAEAVEGP